MFRTFRVSGVALFWGAALLSLSHGALADEPAPTTPPAPDTPPPDAPAAEPAPTAEELKKLNEALGADQKVGATNQPANVPDLSKVNVAAMIPGVQSLNPDISVILDVAAAGFGVARASKPGSVYSDAVPIMTGGHDPVSNGFTLRQVELSFSANVDPFLRFDSNIVIKDTIEVEEAYATTLALPANLQLRMGEFLSKFGRQNEQHPHAWWFISQPLVYGQLMGEDDFRGLGIEASWLSPLPWSFVVIAELQGTSGACCSRTFSPIDDKSVPVVSPLDLVATGIVEQFFPLTDNLSLLWGLDAMTGPTPYLNPLNQIGTQPGARGEIYGTDVLFRYKPVDSDTRWFIEWQSEAMLRTRQPGDGSNIVDGGAYSQIVWHPNPEYGAGVRYDYVYGLDHDLASANGGLGPNSQRVAVVAEYAPTHFSRIQFEANTGTRGQGDLLWGAIINLEVAVGAHGAHAY